MHSEIPQQRLQETEQKRLLLLCTTTGYQTRAFVEAAEKLGLKVAFGSDRCHKLDDPWQDGALALRFENPSESARSVVDYARSHPMDALVALGDRATPLRRLLVANWDWPPILLKRWKLVGISIRLAASSNLLVSRSPPFEDFPSMRILVRLSPRSSSHACSSPWHYRAAAE